jgi:hypothetical protein
LTETADLFVDGIKRIESFVGAGRGSVGGGPELAWGQRQAAVDGDANYNFISFNVGTDASLPEPAPILLLGMGLGLIGFLSKRKRPWESALPQ